MFYLSGKFVWFYLLDHLSKAQDELLWSLAVRRPFIVRPFTPLNDFSSVTPGPIFFKLHVEPCVKGESKILYKWSRSVNQDGRDGHIW